MKIIIDPLIFSAFGSASLPSSDDIDLLRHDLSRLVQVMRLARAKIALHSDAWVSLYKQHISFAHSQCDDHEIRAAIAILRKEHVPSSEVNVKVRAWGIRALMGSASSNGEYWADAIARSAAAEILSGQQVLVFTSLEEGRNCILHQVQNSVLFEKTRWAVYVSAIGLNGATRVPCVTSVRNIRIPWTARYDDDLPDTSPSIGFSFMPPDRWWKRSVVAVRTVRGKPAWIDGSGNGWVSPNTPGTSYHWDVHFVDSTKSPNRLDPCNIVKWGVPLSEGTCGAVHHVPAGKLSRAKQ